MIQQNGRLSKSEAVRIELEAFSENSSHNLRSLMGRLVHGSFKFQKAKGVPVPKLDATGKPTGKFRPIVLAPVESRIVQRAILNVLVEVDALKPFVNTPYSFGGIRSSRQRGAQKRDEHVSAVPAAIQAILKDIGTGARYVASADISAFFTRVPRDYVLGIIGDAIRDDEFLTIVSQATQVELHNIAQLREKTASFPIEEIGVAQGNSLSPLLGNIALAHFDKLLNQGDCRCIRYIDDFMIMAPSQRAANARLRQARTILAEMSMELSPEKSSKGGVPISDEFEFLGIAICPGLIRPSKKAQDRFLASLTRSSADSRKAMVGFANGNEFDRKYALTATLKRLDGMIDGWGKHYWFCNDGQSFKNLDVAINDIVRGLLGTYRSTREELNPENRALLLGLAQLSQSRREPFKYPQIQSSKSTRASNRTRVPATVG